jgi:HD-GYP domain-containing protein (c-di-GMP phosphodiesterase class II)
MPEGKKRQVRARWYLALICLAGGAVLAASLPSVVRSASPDWLILAGLTFLTGSFTVKVPSVPARLSVSETFVFAAVLLYGPGIATVIVALDSFVMSVRLSAGQRSMYRVFFNTASGSVAIWISAHIFFWLAGTTVVPVDFAPEQLLLPVATLAISYFILNSSLISIALSFDRDASAYSIWRTNFVWLILNYIGGASVTLLLVSYTKDLNLTALGIIVPILLTTYLTFRTSLGRLDDANRHVEQVNALYMSAIEALAMAVDAKDQITHGHIRRVQVYAIGLAKRIGVTDEQQLQSIEAAALLHDMGKLAIPEHILNKPGRLTSAEFEKMKRHSDIGADLLASIPFPYPVVPIVRHHHENWDGTGYPNRIAGTDIPLGARILAVVDCFDALTSDRPYRPRLSPAAAFEILRERRGTMYDPLIVDAFSEAYAVIEPLATMAGYQARSLLPAVAAETPERARALNEIQLGSSESIALAELRAALARSPSFAELSVVTLPIISRFTPATLLAVYIDSVGQDVLRCVSAATDPGGLMEGFEIQCGERTTGWVAANQRTIVNSSASLDLGDRANAFAPPLKTALSTPIPSNGALGVLTAYSTLESPFTAQHAYFLEQVAGILASRLPDAEKIHTLLRFPEAPKGTQVRR